MPITACTICAPEPPKHPQKSCKVNTRKGQCIKRVGQISCESSVDPFSLVGQSPSTIYTALNTIIAEGNMGWTGLLSAGEFGDPQSIVENDAECLAPVETVGSRELTFNDYNGYDVDESGSSAPYFEYDLYETLNKNGGNYYFWHLDCNDDLWLYYRDVNGTIFPISANAYAFRTMEKIQAGNSTICKQVIRVKISFLGDPLNFKVKPLVNLAGATGDIANLK